MPRRINKERVNDRFKLALHRLYARELARRPDLLERARGLVAHWRTEPDQPSYVKEWSALLALPDDQVRPLLTQRNERMTRLRLSSPFGLLANPCLTEEDRRRLWRSCRRALERRA